MTELIYSERFLKFIKVAFSQQIEAGKMKPAYIFESNDSDSPFSRVGALEIELWHNKVNGNFDTLRDKINGVKEWIKYVHKQGEKINDLHGEGKTELKYLTYSYSGKSFGTVAHAPDVRFNFTLHHGYFKIIEYLEEVYKLLEMVVPDEKLTGTNYPPEKLRKIFDELVAQKITNKSDKVNFLSIFTNEPKGKVFWDGSILASHKVLFYLMEKLKDRPIKPKELNDNFISSRPPFHGHDKTGNEVKWIDEILRGI